MTRRSIVAVALLLTAVLPSGGSPASAFAPKTSDPAPVERPLGVLPIQQMGERYGTFDLPMPPAGQTAEQRAHWLLEERPALGRTPNDWIRWSQEAFQAAAPADPGAPVTHADLTAGVLRLYAAAGLPVTSAVGIAVSEEASRLPVSLRTPFADLVGTVADVYEAQLTIVRDVLIRWTAGFDPHNPPLTLAERDLMTARQESIVDAINLFRARTAPAFDMLRPGISPAGGGTDPPLFADPEGLVILGGTGNGTYTRGGLVPDPILLVDPSGSDRYENSAGGACPVTPPELFFLGGPWLECNLLVVSVVADLGDGITSPSDDDYVYNGPPSAVQGAGGPGGIGILLDVGGNDEYLATMTRGSNEPFIPLLFYYFDGGGQGFGYAGAGLLVDGVGNDIYRFDVASTHGNSIWALAQGWGGAGGIGIVSDGIGNDAWLSNGLGLTGGGFQGVYTDGVGFYGGVGIMTDTGQGVDTYAATLVAQTTDFYAQGFGAFGGVGILYEDGGNDNYYTHMEASDPWIDPLLNCAYGTASFGGVGVMVDVAGDDVYFGATVGPRESTIMDSGFGGPGVAYGLFVDTGGTDRYEMTASGSSTMIQGRGLWEIDTPLPGHNTWGTFVDIGGADTYIGGPGANDSQWPFGVDRGA